MNGDAAWLEKLYRQHYELLYRLGSRLCAHYGLPPDSLYDQMQEVFLILWRRREALKAHPNPGGWLVNALKLQLMAQSRKPAQKEAPLSPSAEKIAEGPPTPPELFLQKEAVRAVERLLGRETAALFFAYTLEGIPGRELATRLGISEASLRMRVSRAKKKLMQHPEVFSLLLFSLLGFGR